MDKVLIVGLAAYYLVAAWLKSPLVWPLRDARAWAEAATENGNTWAKLLTCPICLGFWVGLVMWMLWVSGGEGYVAVLATAGVVTFLYLATERGST